MKFWARGFQVIVGRVGVPCKGGAPSTEIIRRKQELTLVEEVEQETNMLQWNGCWEGWCWMLMEIRVAVEGEVQMTQIKNMTLIAVNATLG